MTSNGWMWKWERKEKKVPKQTDNLEFFTSRPWKKISSFCRSFVDFTIYLHFIFSHRSERIYLNNSEIFKPEKLFNFHHHRHHLNEICLNFLCALSENSQEKKKLLHHDLHTLPFISRTFLTLLAAYLTLFISFVCSRDVTIK